MCVKVSKLPETVKIGPSTYTVVEAPITDYGLCDFAQHTIVIRKGLTTDAKKITLWHEVIHGMLTSLGYVNHDELMVDGLAHVMVQVLRDNPKLRS